jgi:triacylglycerol esterase/lipase EstA (alpha/beta hydrolase family)
VYRSRVAGARLADLRPARNHDFPNGVVNAEAFCTSPVTCDIAEGAQQLSSFVDQVLAAAGASQVDIVGHSL